MNRTMGAYIDGLTDVERDRLVTAEQFNDGVTWWRDGCGCLVGTAEHYPDVLKLPIGEYILELSEGA